MARFNRQTKSKIWFCKRTKESFVLVFLGLSIKYANIPPTTTPPIIYKTIISLLYQKDKKQWRATPAPHRGASRFTPGMEVPDCYGAARHTKYSTINKMTLRPNTKGSPLCLALIFYSARARGRCENCNSTPQRTYLYFQSIHFFFDRIVKLISSFIKRLLSRRLKVFKCLIFVSSGKVQSSSS